MADMAAFNINTTPKPSWNKAVEVLKTLYSELIDVNNSAAGPSMEELDSIPKVIS